MKEGLLGIFVVSDNNDDVRLFFRGAAVLVVVVVPEGLDLFLVGVLGVLAPATLRSFL